MVMFSFFINTSTSCLCGCQWAMIDELQPHGYNARLLYLFLYLIELESTSLWKKSLIDIDIWASSQLCQIHCWVQGTYTSGHAVSSVRYTFGNKGHIHLGMQSALSDTLLGTRDKDIWACSQLCQIHCWVQGT